MQSTQVSKEYLVYCLRVLLSKSIDIKTFIPKYALYWPVSRSPCGILHNKIIQSKRSLISDHYPLIYLYLPCQHFLTLSRHRAENQNHYHLCCPNCYNESFYMVNSQKGFVSSAQAASRTERSHPRETWFWVKTQDCRAKESEGLLC